MTTTIQVKDTTKEMLEDLKEKKNIASYDAVIMNLIMDSRKKRKSMFGVLPKDGDILKDLRDKHDRF